MKNIGKIAILGAALVAASSSFAFADTVQLASFAGAAPAGIGNTALLYGGFVANNGALGTFVADPSAFITNGTAATVNIGAGDPWHAALGSSSWVSNIAGTNPASGPAVIEDNGYYTFTTTFSVANTANYNFALNLLADDTLAIYLNTGAGNVLKVSAGPLGDDGACATGIGSISCETPTTDTFSANLAAGATDTLTFVVEQTGRADFGLDFTGTVSATPEPSSLMLLGTGLVGAAGMLFRKRLAA